MLDWTELMDRTTFLRRSGALLGMVVLDRSSHRPLLSARTSTHPDPRPGVNAERVLSTDALGLLPEDKVVAAYNAARKYPELFDGLSCACGCTGKHGTHRSLLVCYETRQPTSCAGCRDEAQLVAK